MKTRLTILFSLLFVVIIFNSNYAQPGRGMDLNARVTELKEKLKLTDKQEKEIKKILTDQQTKMTKMRDENPDDDRMAVFDKFMKLRKETDDKVLKVLNKEQKIEYKKILDERMKKFQNRGGGF